MPGATSLTLIGTIGQDPEVRQVGAASVTNFSVAVSERKFNRESNQFEDAGTSWFRCSAWRELGEHAAGSLNKGDRVIVQGTLREREYEKDGETRKAWEVEVDEIGPSLRFATATVIRVPAGGGQQRGGQQRQQPRQQPQQRQQQPAQPDTWGAGSYDDETPF